MSHIDEIDFSNEVLILKKQVSISDVYGLHFLAEEIIETELSWNEINAMVRKSPHGKTINLFYISFSDNGQTQTIEWDDYSSRLVHSIDGKAKEEKNYYLLNEHTPYGPFPMNLFLP